MRVLVTGGAGFLGGAIVKQLRARGDEVRVFSRREGGDVADASAVRAAVEGCDAVIHTAAKVGSWGRYDDYYRTNVAGTQNIIDAMRLHGVTRLVYTSSPSVIGDGDLDGVDESHPYARAYDADYPKTKAMAERLVREAGGIALRPHLIFGPGDTQLFPRLIERARAGKVMLPGGPPKLVDITYIDNAVDAHLAALDRLPECAGSVYFISQGEPVQIPWLINRVLDAAGLPPIKKSVSPAALRAMGRAAEAAFSLLRIHDREPPITRFVARQLSTSHWFDISAARRDLGYVPRVTIEEGMQRLRTSLNA